jgi:hypothetical protein
MWVGCWV